MISIKSKLPNLGSEPDVFKHDLLNRLKELESQGVIVQAQPVGLMRIALNNQPNSADGLFLHVWVPGLPMQATGGPFAHTHVFHLRSRIIKGVIKDVVYKPIPNQNGAYKLVKGVCRQDYCSLRDEISRVSMLVEEERVVNANEVYELPKGKMHITNICGDGVAVTLMEKINTEHDDPIVAIPYSATIREEQFDRNQLDQKAAWKQIKQILQDI